MKSVIHSMLVHCITIYSWPVHLIKDLERWMKNFIWSGDVNKRNLVTVAWHKVCSPINAGGLRIRSLSKINEGANLKLCWAMVQSNLPWAQFVRNRVLKNNVPIAYHISSSIWTSIKHKYREVISNSSWLLGIGHDINFWNDLWCGNSIVSSLDIPIAFHPFLKAIVSQFIINHSWSIPQNLLQIFPNLHNFIKDVSIHVIEKEDKIIWKHSHDRGLFFKEAYQFHCNGGQNLSWAKNIWNNAIPPSKSTMIWRTLHNKLPTDDNLSLRGCNISSMCSLCDKAQETIAHLFLECSFATSIWHWLSSIINLKCTFTLIQEAIQLVHRNWSPLCKIVVLAAVTNIINIIWFYRNQTRFNNKKINFKSAINLIIAGTTMSGNRLKCDANTSISDFVLLRAFSIKLNYGRASRIKEILWQSPVFHWIKYNIDGAFVGNLGPSSCGGIYRNNNVEFMGAFAYNLGNANSLVAEVNGAMFAIELAHQKGWRQVWLETDSMLVTLCNDPIFYTCHFNNFLELFIYLNLFNQFGVIK